MKVFVFNSFLVVRNPWWRLQQVLIFPSNDGLPLISPLVFAIQKCDPAPFYLFDEVNIFITPFANTDLSLSTDRC